MSVRMKSRHAVAVVIFVFTVSITTATTLAQRIDLDALLRETRELQKAGRYSAALIEAQKLAAAVEARFGTHHQNYAGVLSILAQLYYAQGQYAQAEGIVRRVLEIREQALGGSHPKVADTLNNLAIIFKAEGNFAEAENRLRQALAIRERALGANDREIATTLSNLATVFDAQGRYAQAEELDKRALAIREKTLGANHPELADSLNNLAAIYRVQGQDAKAEALYRRALAIREKAFGASHSIVADTLDNLANIFQTEGRSVEAEGLYKRAIEIKQKALGPRHPSLAETLNNLANIYQSQGQYADAEALYRRALTILETVFGASHPKVAPVLNNLAYVYEVRGQYSEAERFYQRAITLKERALGADHTSVALSLMDLANVYQHEGEYARADEILKRALAIREKAFGADHPDVAVTLDNLALLNVARGDISSALNWSRMAIKTVLAHAASEARDGLSSAPPARTVTQRAEFFRRHLFIISTAAQKGMEPQAFLAKEALETGQWALQSSAARAAQQMTARFAAGGGALGALVRESQDLSGAWQNADKSLIAELSKPESQQVRATIDALRKQIAEIKGKLRANTARIEKQFPDYATLINPKPLKAAEVQKLLGTDEALVFLLTAETQTYLFALTHDELEWRTIQIGAKNLTEVISHFRLGLDVGQLSNSGNAKPVLFDLSLAHGLYATLLGSVEPLIRNKRHLLVVPAGPLTALPFHLLVTDKPAIARPRVTDIASYRDAAWLLRRHAVTVLPSVASLKALRVFANTDRAAKPMIGFGDPVFKEGDQKLEDRQRRVGPRSVGETRAYTEFWRGAGVDRKMLAEALPRLAGTADELKTIAEAVGAPASDIHLRKEASETTVKHASLANYRIVYFATHALVAGDVKGLGEPSLALSIPRQPTDFDDGLLTVSEVAQLKLNADWVVLSACNTIAGDKPGAEALSGLARAFFYAGARALLVSHWAVASEAATRLTTTTFSTLKREPKIDRAEALRRAMLSYLNDTSNMWNAYPAFWGPFELVGEAAARQG